MPVFDNPLLVGADLNNGQIAFLQAAALKTQCVFSFLPCCRARAVDKLTSPSCIVLGLNWLRRADSNSSPDRKIPEMDMH